MIGSSLDPEMSDELRVTVVATGIGGDRRADVSIAQNNANVSRPIENRPQSLQDSLRSATNLSGNTSADISVQSQNANTAPKPKQEQDYLDIPAFLRKQAD